MFKKYHSIENHYQNKYIKLFLEKYPELNNAYYSIEHKIDGANISILIDENDNVSWAKRSGIIDDNENFMGLNTIKNEYDELIESLIKWKNEKGYDKLQLIGELHGPGIQNRVKYCDEKNIEFFDVIVNGKFLSPVWFYELMSDIGYHNKKVKVFEIVRGLENALNANTEYKTHYDSLIEGVVIKPYTCNYISPVGERFVLKKKNTAFSEKQKKSKKPKKENVYSSEVENARKEFESYINENRVLSIFSKEGEIENSNEIGKYIKLILEDAKEDFLKENSVDGFTKKEKKYIFNVSGHIVPILRKYL